MLSAAGHGPAAWVGSHAGTWWRAGRGGDLMARARRRGDRGRGAGRRDGREGGAGRRRDDGRPPWRAGPGACRRLGGDRAVRLGAGPGHRAAGRGAGRALGDRAGVRQPGRQRHHAGERGAVAGPPWHRLGAGRRHPAGPSRRHRGAAGAAAVLGVLGWWQRPPGAAGRRRQAVGAALACRAAKAGAGGRQRHLPGGAAGGGPAPAGAAARLLGGAGGQGPRRRSQPRARGGAVRVVGHEVVGPDRRGREPGRLRPGREAGVWFGCRADVGLHQGEPAAPGSRALPGRTRPAGEGSPAASADAPGTASRRAVGKLGVDRHGVGGSLGRGGAATSGSGFSAGLSVKGSTADIAHLGGGETTVNVGRGQVGISDDGSIAVGGEVRGVSVGGGGSAAVGRSSSVSGYFFTWESVVRPSPSPAMGSLVDLLAGLF